MGIDLLILGCNDKITANLVKGCESANFLVDCAMDPVYAAESLKTEQPKVVFADVHFHPTGRHGEAGILAFMEQYAELSPDTKYVVYGRNYTETEKAALEANPQVAATLTTPLDYENMVKMLRNLLNGK